MRATSSLVSRSNRLRILIALLALSIPASAEERISEYERALGSIDQIEAYRYCREIASPKYAGRLTGHEGYAQAARWAAGKFAEWGLRPLPGAEGFLQPFPCPYTVVEGSSLTLVRGGPGGTDRAVDLRPLEDFLPMMFTDGGAVESELVFAGWGIHAPELGYDDYEGIDAAGRFVLCFRGTPDRRRLEFEEHDQHRHRMETAQRMGARGLFYIYDEPVANPNGDRLEGFLCGIVSETIGDTILAGTGWSADALRDTLSQTGRPRSFPTGTRARYSAQVVHDADATGYNVSAMLPGSEDGPDRTCVVLGAHFDHCGEHMGYIFPGAQDNASGSAVVLEIARAFAGLDRAPARTVVFVLFGAEEMGLIGSYRAAEFIEARFDSITAMLNFDMDGQGDGTSCGVTPEPPELRRAVEQADSLVGTLRRVREITHVGVRSSDYAPFFLKGAACAAFFSNGPHLHYHRPQDTIYRINPEMLGDVARLGFGTAYRLAGGAGVPGGR